MVLLYNPVAGYLVIKLPKCLFGDPAGIESLLASTEWWCGEVGPVSFLSFCVAWSFHLIVKINALLFGFFSWSSDMDLFDIFLFPISYFFLNPFQLFISNVLCSLLVSIYPSHSWFW